MRFLRVRQIDCSVSTARTLPTKHGDRLWPHLVLCHTVLPHPHELCWLLSTFPPLCVCLPFFLCHFCGLFNRVGGPCRASPKNQSVPSSAASDNSDGLTIQNVSQSISYIGCRPGTGLLVTSERKGRCVAPPIFERRSNGELTVLYICGETLVPDESTSPPIARR